MKYKYIKELGNQIKSHLSSKPVILTTDHRNTSKELGNQIKSHLSSKPVILTTDHRNTSIHWHTDLAYFLCEYFFFYFYFITLLF